VLWCYERVEWLERRGELVLCVDAKPNLQALRQRPYRGAARIHLILDGGASHIAGDTRAWFATPPRLRVLYTPAHASWLDQAELLLRAFSDRYLGHLDVRSRRALNHASRRELARVQPALRAPIRVVLDAP
jgi:glycine/D-amino acid oxidase-like deaminating enzyme